TPSFRGAPSASDDVQIAHLRISSRMLAPPLPLWERSDRIDRCDPGEGLRHRDSRIEPLTPTLSHKGRGSSPPLRRPRRYLLSPLAVTGRTGSPSRKSEPARATTISPSFTPSRISTWPPAIKPTSTRLVSTRERRITWTTVPPVP